MSDIRTKILLGTSIGALAMIFVMAAGVDAFKTTTATGSSALYGHGVVMAVHPDGSVNYAQSDNVVIDAGKLVGIGQLFDPDNVLAAKVFNCIEMGSGGVAANGAAATIPVTPLGTAGQQCTNGTSCTDLNTANAGTCSVVLVASVATDDPATATIKVQFPPLVIGDMTDGPQTIVTINEVALENLNAQGPTAISSFGITPIGGVIGTVVTITYTMELD